MNVLKKLQNLSESKRKIILWVVVIAFGLALFFSWGIAAKNKLRNFQKEDFIESFPPFENSLQKMPEIEMPEFEAPELSEEELKQLEEMMKESELQNKNQNTE